jgi:hypothetical protein
VSANSDAKAFARADASGASFHQKYCDCGTMNILINIIIIIIAVVGFFYCCSVGAAEEKCHIRAS